MRIRIQVVIESENGRQEQIEEVGCFERGALRPEELGLTLYEAKQLLHGVQQTVVTEQVEQYLAGARCSRVPWFAKLVTTKRPAKMGCFLNKWVRVIFEDYTLLNWDDRLALGPKQLAKWLRSGEARPAALFACKRRAVRIRYARADVLGVGRTGDDARFAPRALCGWAHQRTQFRSRTTMPTWQRRAAKRGERRR